MKIGQYIYVSKFHEYWLLILLRKAVYAQPHFMKIGQYIYVSKFHENLLYFLLKKMVYA